MVSQFRRRGEPGRPKTGHFVDIPGSSRTDRAAVMLLAVGSEREWVLSRAPEISSGLGRRERPSLSTATTSGSLDELLLAPNQAPSPFRLF